jgi:hypothetical protein
MNTNSRKQKWTLKKLMEVELRNINAALRYAEMLAKQHKEKIEYFPEAKASITKIRRLLSSVEKQIDEAKYDGMMEQRAVDKMLNGESK